MKNFDWSQEEVNTAQYLCRLCFCGIKVFEDYDYSNHIFGSGIREIHPNSVANNWLY